MADEAAAGVFFESRRLCIALEEAARVILGQRQLALLQIVLLQYFRQLLLSSSWRLLAFLFPL